MLTTNVLMSGMLGTAGSMGGGRGNAITMRGVVEGL